MAGLLDTLGSDDVLGGLLSAGAASGARGNFLSRMAAGLSAGDKFSRGRAEEKRQRSQEEMQAEYRALVTKKMQMDMEREQRADTDARTKRDALPGLFSGQQIPGQVSTPTMGGVEMFSQGSTQTPPRTVGAGQIDLLRALKAGYSADEITKLSGLSNLGKPKVSKIETVSINGKPMKVGIDEYGQQVAQIGMEWRPLKTQDMGGYVGAFDETDPGAGMRNIGTKTQTAESIASNATTQRGQNMTDARAREFNATAAAANDIKRGEKAQVADMTKNSQVASFDTMLGTLGRLKVHPGLSRSVGVTGMFPTMPGTESANFQAELDTFQSQAFIPMVAQLKGMGALSDAEGRKLTAAVGALNPKMGEAAFRASVDRIIADMENARARVSGAPIATKSGGASGGWDGKAAGEWSIQKE